MCKSIVEQPVRVTCPNRAGRQGRTLWAGGVPTEVGWPAPGLETTLGESLRLSGKSLRTGVSLWTPPWGTQDRAWALLADPCLEGTLPSQVGSRVPPSAMCKAGRVSHFGRSQRVPLVHSFSSY